MSNLVLMIHGINSSGQWREGVRKVLEVYDYECASISYRDYFGAGATKIYFWPWALLFGSVLIWSTTDLHVTAVLWGTFAIVAVFACACELYWSAFRATPILLLQVTVCLAVAIWASWIDPSRGDLILWVGTAACVAILEVSEQSESGSVRSALLFSPVIACLAALIAGIVWMLVQQAGWLALGPILLALTVSGFCEPVYRHNRVCRKVYDRISRLVGGREPPHVIAHSLGTLMIGSVLKKYPGLHLDHLILLGCVLHEEFPWADLLHEGRQGVVRVRNEQGRKDRVVKLAGLARSLSLGLAKWPLVGSVTRAVWSNWREIPGIAGVVGFRSPPDRIHSLKDEFAGCAQCEVSTVPIHNVLLTDFDHSTFADGALHAWNLWVPFLGGYVQADYTDLMRSCQKGYRHLQPASKDIVEFAKVEKHLQSKHWRLESGAAKPKTLRDYCNDVLPGLLRDRKKSLPPDELERVVNGMMDRVPAFLCESVGRAGAELRKADGRRDRATLGALRPSIAIGTALERALDVELVLPRTP